MKNRKIKSFNHILISGASRGLGEGLALAYSTPGVKLYLIARNENNLNKVATKCRSKGAEVEILIGDVNDDQKLINFFNHIAQLDLVIANAGISAGTSNGFEGPLQVKEIFSTNVIGVSNIVEMAIPKMTHNSSIAIISSLASFLPMASAPSYAASKTAVRYYGLALRQLLAPKIKVTIICPGFIDTDMTKINKFKMPFLMSVEQAANIITKKLRGQPRQIIFPSILAIGLKIFNALPDFIIEYFTKFLPKK